MSGHSKWHSIKHKKGLADAKRGKIFTIHSKLITIATREGGGDPETNSSLRTAIDNAKTANVPNTNIERAIKRGTGELKDQAEITENMYEGYGPAGIAVYIQTLTDNKNRTVASVKSILTKNGGNMGTAGSVAYLFHKKGLISLVAEPDKHEEIELSAIDAGAEDIKIDENNVEIYTDPKNLHEVKRKLEEADIAVESAEITFIPENEIKIDDETKARKVLKFMDALEEDDDVTNVYSNFDIPEEIIKKLEE
ncbi:YebC/PmpR family DNA-binding transcriptional regulator [bacterium]|nr:YebC/PmpR family DNA-binding transcriptional regulator [bacterium]